MRLIGEFQNEKEAFEFQLFLQNHEIKSVYDQALEGYRLWVIEEDQFEKALAYYHQWKQDPSSQQFKVAQEKTSAQNASNPRFSWKVKPPLPPNRASFSLTHFLITVCGLVFLWTLFQEGSMVKSQEAIALEYELVPIQKQLLFDYPASLSKVENFLEQHDVRTEEELKQIPAEDLATFNQIQNEPTWKGISDIVVNRNWELIQKLPEGTLFGKIRQGQLWRLITPVLLHGGWLHLFFNMAWLFILGHQIEERIGKSRYLLLSLLLGVISNVAQYLAAGPIFLGYSGIITGMVGFIWVRQKFAPWEGYPLQRSVIALITVFVAIMFALELVSMALQFFHVTEIYPNIANAAHIFGGLCGVILGRLSFFARHQK